MSRTTRISWVLVVVAVAVGLIALSRHGSSIHTDLSVVGQGRPVLVLGYENFSPASTDALERLRAVQPDYQDRMEFVIADLGTPEGQAFAVRHGLSSGLTVFLGPDGRHIELAGVPAAEDQLRAQLDRQLAR